MSKQIVQKIEECQTCPYYREQVFPGGGAFNALCAKEERIIALYQNGMQPTHITIPDWCPLEEVLS